METVTITNMCMIYEGNKILVQDRVKKNWSGLSFPGGHVELGESFVDSVRREVFEETGLTVGHVELCGIKQFQTTNGRYMVLLYKSNEYQGELTDSEEGKMFWIDRDSLLDYELTEDFEHVIRVFEEEFSEIVYHKEDDELKRRLL